MAVDISVLGVPELQRKLRALPEKIQKRVAVSALRKAVTRAKRRIISHLSGSRVGVRTGALRRGFKRAKTKSASRRNFLRLGLELPQRSDLGIPEGDKYYYPLAVEYGHTNAPAHPYIRPAIDDYREEEFAKLASDIGKGIEREAAKR